MLVSNYFIPTYCIFSKKCVVKEIFISKRRIRDVQAKAVEDSFALYSDETMEAEDKAFLLKLRDTTMAAIDEAHFSRVVGRLQGSMAV